LVTKYHISSPDPHRLIDRDLLDSNLSGVLEGVCLRQEEFDQDGRSLNRELIIYQPLATQLEKQI
jgi:hypothetical protein